MDHESSDYIAHIVHVWISEHKELAFNFEAEQDYVFPDWTLLSRDTLQEALESTPKLFTESDFRKIKAADTYVLDHLNEAAIWVRNLHFSAEKPARYWWWHLDRIADEMMDPPNLDQIFDSYIKKAEDKTARAF